MFSINFINSANKGVKALLVNFYQPKPKVPQEKTIAKLLTSVEKVVIT